MRKIICSSVVSLIIVFSVFADSARAQETDAAEKFVAPVVTEVVPREIAPGMCIKIIGRKLGGIDKNKIVFLQGSTRFETNANGASWDDDDLENGVNEQVVEVPKQIGIGATQLIIENKGLVSPAFALEVLAVAKPPKITELTPLFIKPGESLSVDGIGMSDLDTIELTDSNGAVHLLKIWAFSNHGSAGVFIPENIAAGTVALRVIENSTGSQQPSNTLAFKVKRGAVPLTLSVDGLVSLAPGQWLEPILWNGDPLVNATKIEFLLKQNGERHTASTTNVRRVRFQIPASFVAGKIEIQTRTIIGDDTSEWSQPVSYTVAEKAAQPLLESIEPIPAKAEAMFKQNDKVVAVAPLDLGVSPFAPMPKELIDGKLEVFTRYTDKGKTSEWKSVRKYESFSRASKQFVIQPEYNKEPQLQLDSFYERVYAARQNKPFVILDAARGQNLRLYGDFYHGSTNELQVILENAKQSIVLEPIQHEMVQ